jgi:hypothetical protein
MSEEEFNHRQNALLFLVPIQFRSALSSYAWEHGHANGYSEVLCILSDLVGLLASPIAEFDKARRA